MASINEFNLAVGTLSELCASMLITADDVRPSAISQNKD